jgi:glycosyltransferase involved in cell wall biosynthesis
VNVAVVAEYYPRRRDPVLGVWAHRQALAARDAGADVKVFVLERPVPPAADIRRPWRLPRRLTSIARQPSIDTIDGIEVHYVRFVAPSRTRAYASWHEAAAKPLSKTLARVHRDWPVDVVHAHYALPAGGAALPFARQNDLPLVVSIHGGDVYGPLLASDDARAAVAAVLDAATEVLCNSRATLLRAAALARSDERIRVLHLGADPAPGLVRKRERSTVVTLGHLVPRKRHVDVLEAVASMRDVDWVVIGDGPELSALEERVQLMGLGERVELMGQLAPSEALAELARGHVMALPSVDEAFGVAYVEALASGVPAIGTRGEGGPEEIAALGGGMLLVPPEDPRALAAAIRRALADPGLPDAARRTAVEHFSWEHCGRETVQAYRDARNG